MACVANVIEGQLHDLDPNRVRARQRAQARVRELSLFDPVGGKIWNEPGRPAGASPVRALGKYPGTGMAVADQREQ